MWGATHGRNLQSCCAVVVGARAPLLISGLAVVAYDYAAAQQHIRHGENGVLAPFGAADDYAQAAAALVNDAPRIRALGERARVTTEKLDWSFIVAEFEQALLRMTDSAQAQMIATHAVA